MNNIKILLIVEGEKNEKSFISRLTELYGIHCEIFDVRNNIFTLYEKLKREDFQCNIKDILREYNLPEEMKTLLRDDFAYTYLILDSELQDRRAKEDGDSVPMEFRVSRNIDRLIEMAEYFDDETDPTKGRLYINYPMMESYRDCDSFYDKQFINNTVKLSDIPRYKDIAAKRRLSGFDIRKFTKQNFSDLIRMNVNKLAYISGAKDYHIFPYNEYLQKSLGTEVAAVQKRCIKDESFLYVLNTSLFFLIDYYGNREGFYDSVIKSTTK